MSLSELLFSHVLLSKMYPVEDGNPHKRLCNRLQSQLSERIMRHPCGLSLDDAPITGPSDTTFVHARDTNKHRDVETFVGVVSQMDEFIWYFTNPSIRKILFGSNSRPRRPAVRAKSSHSMTALDPFT